MMIQKKFKLLLFILIFPQCSINNEISNNEIEKLFSSVHFEDNNYITNGIIRVFKLKDFKSKYDGVELVTITIKNPKIRIQFVGTSGDRDVIYPIQADSNTVVIINGGYFGYNYKKKLIPLGLLIENSKTKSKLTPWKTGGIIHEKNGKINISSIIKFDNSINYNNALQSKPIVVNGGNSEIYSKNLKWRNRTAIGIDNDNNIVIAGVFNTGTGAMSLFDFAKILSYKSKGKSLVDIALAMDGGKSSYIYIPKLNKSWGKKVPLFVPNVVLFNK